MPTPDLDSALTLEPFFRWDTFTPQPVVDLGLSLDSLFPARELPPLVVRPSLFAPSALPVSSGGLLERASSAQPAWLFVLLVALLVLLCVYYRARKVKVSQLLPALVSGRALDRLVRACNLTPLRLLSSGLLMVAAVAVAIYPFFFPAASFLGWATVALVLAAAYFTRWGLLRFVAKVFYSHDAMSAYITNAYLYHLFLATVLIPLLFFMSYMPFGTGFLFTAFFCIIFVVFLTRLLRGISLFLTQAPPRSFNLFFYLCTVEIAPLLVIVKWLFVQ